jgi:hypothetical protein
MSLTLGRFVEFPRAAPSGIPQTSLGFRGHLITNFPHIMVLLIINYVHKVWHNRYKINLPYLRFRIPFRRHSLLIYLLKLNSNFTREEYVTMATRVLAGKMSKYSIKFSTNSFSKLKFLEPILPDLSMTKTMSSLGGARKKYKFC